MRNLMSYQVMSLGADYNAALLCRLGEEGRNYSDV